MAQTTISPVKECDVGHRIKNKTSTSSSLTLVAIWRALLTYYTGKAHPGQTPLFPIKKMTELLLNLAWLCVFALIGLWIANRMPYETPQLWPVWLAAYYFTAVFITGRLRYLSTGAAHYAIHNSFSKSRKVNKWIANVCLAITLGNPEDYFKSHMPHHQNKIFTTIHDDDTAYLHRYGFRPGMTQAELWHHLILTCLSPIYHSKALLGRLQSIGRAKPTYKLLMVIWSIVLAIVLLKIQFMAFILVVVLPLTVFFQVSVLLQLLTEHTWKPEGKAPTDDYEYAKRCAGRFCGLPLPKTEAGSSLNLLAWIGWVSSIIFIQTPVRFGVLVSDLTVHDFHHLGGKLGFDHEDWMMSRFDREKAIQSGDIFGMGTRENWGLKSMLNWQFNNYANTQRHAN